MKRDGKVLMTSTYRVLQGGIDHDLLKLCQTGRDAFRTLIEHFHEI
jgi:hypothetical protein